MLFVLTGISEIDRYYLLLQLARVREHLCDTRAHAGDRLVPACPKRRGPTIEKGGSTIGTIEMEPIIQ